MESVSSSSSSTEPTKPPRLVKFLLGTVAQVHLSALKECFLFLTELQEPVKYTDATGSIVIAVAKGDAMIPVFFDSTITWLKLKDVYYTPCSDPRYSLISVTGLYAAGISVEWKSDIDHCSLLDNSMNVVARGHSRDSQWYLDVELELIRYNNPDIQNPCSGDSTPETPDMGYSESTSTQSLNSMGVIGDSSYPPINEECTTEGDDPCVLSGVDEDFPDSSDCEDCSSDDSTGVAPLSLVHSDLYGPLPVSVGGNRYAASFIDDYSRFARIYFLKSPGNYLTAVKSFVQLVEKDTKSSYSIQVLHSGRAVGEYVSAYLSDREITQRITSQQDSVAREFNRTIFTRVQSMLYETELEHGWWEDAAAMAVYIFNRSPNSSVDFNLPLDIWTQSQEGPGITSAPTSFAYRVFGTRCTATLLETRGKKEVRKELQCRVLRFDTGAGAWVVLTMAGDRVFSTKSITFVDDE